MVPGVAVALPGDEPYKETYFEWRAAPLTAEFATRQVSGGNLKSWKSVPLFTQVETHVDAEMFYFLSGTAIMLFADLARGKPDMDSARIVRIAAGTRIIIPGDTPVSVVVVAPQMEAPRVPLPEPILGVP